MSSWEDWEDQNENDFDMQSNKSISFLQAYQKVIRDCKLWVPIQNENGKNENGND